MSEEEKFPHVTKANALLQEYKEATKKFKEEMVGKGGDKSLNMGDGEVVKHVDNSEDAAMRVEGEEADGDENVD